MPFNSIWCLYFYLLCAYPSNYLLIKYTTLQDVTTATDQDGGQLVVVKELGLVDPCQLLAEWDTTLPHLALVKQLDGIIVEELLPFTSRLARIVTNSLDSLT